MSYRDVLVQRIKEAGQELIERAESMISSDTDAITDFDIYIHIPTTRECTEFPTIQWNTVVVNKNTMKRLREE